MNQYTIFLFSQHDAMRFTISCFALLSLTLLGIGCAGAPAAFGGKPGAIEVRGENDPLESVVVVSTVEYRQPLFLGKGYHDAAFRAFVGKESGVTLHQLYVRTNSTDWMRWEAARTSMNGQTIELETEMLGSDVSCSSRPCSHFEIVGVTLSDSLLSHWVEKGGLVRLYSARTSRSEDVNIPVSEAKAFMETLRSVEKPFRSAPQLPD